MTKLGVGSTVFAVAAFALSFALLFILESDTKTRQTDIEQVTENTFYLHEQSNVYRVLDKSTGTICYVLKGKSISCVQIIMPSKSEDNEL